MWSVEGGMFAATVDEFPFLSFLDVDQERALIGLVGVVDDVIRDLVSCGDPIPKPKGLRGAW